MSASPFSDRSPVLVFFHSGPPLHDLLSFPTRRSSDLIFSRTADHLIAAGDALRRLLARFARPEHRPDVVIATAPAIPTLMVGRVLAARWQIPLVVEMRDDWPELVIHVGSAGAMHAVDSTVPLPVLLGRAS